LPPASPFSRSGAGTAGAGASGAHAVAATPAPGTAAPAGRHKPGSVRPDVGTLTFNGGPNFTMTEGIAGTTGLVEFQDSDGNTNPASYSATINWGDNTSSPGTITYWSGNGGNGPPLPPAFRLGGVGSNVVWDHYFLVSGTHTYAEETPPTYAVSVTVTDTDGASGSVTGTASVADAALTATGDTVTGYAGTGLTGTVAGFTDADPGGTVSDYTATITWGDGSASSAGTVGPGFTVTGGHTYAQPGVYTTTVTITDAGGSTVTTHGQAVISSARPGQKG
jgi:hypothetical protein